MGWKGKVMERKKEEVEQESDLGSQKNKAAVMTNAVHPFTCSLLGTNFSRTPRFYAISKTSRIDPSSHSEQTVSQSKCHQSL